ncbi:ectonucleoside triphosphate diphosphohydrolase 8-like isoform X3 [Pleurodeles waltl]|uniref:ectonucleoside triphosphate diphosphohydrolase 8-like isoform X3 n=1 Tax=Pleurodeles waltl TaxID=8319 RepID=UPI0037096C81
MLTDSKQNTLLCLVVATVFSMIFALILSLVGIINVSLPPKEKYGIVFEAGSTHTDLFIYRWPTDKENDTGVVSQVHMCKVAGPGISSYADEPQKAGESLTKCLDEAMTIIPLANQPETSVSLGATGGMMLLRFHSPEAAQRILDEVSRTIQKYPGNFRGAHILTGLDEGAYNWVTVNYLLHSFMTYSFNGVWVRPATTHMYGALDLGDVATLISFIPNVNIEDKREEATLRLYGVNYTIYTHSYFCYGVHPALKKLLLQAIVAFSGFYDIFNFLNLTKASAFQDVYRKLKEFCSINWNQLRTQYPYEREDWLRDSCGIANYILTLLLDVYKFTEDTWNNIIFQKQVDKTDIGWTLGHMLNLTNMIPAEATVNIHGQDYRFWTAAIFFIVFALALSVIMLIIYMKC